MLPILSTSNCNSFYTVLKSGFKNIHGMLIISSTALVFQQQGEVIYKIVNRD